MACREAREGLSPRVRGNRRRGRNDRHHQGSIPACAGEPRGRYRSAGGDEVYPRVCGGTHRAGLSVRRGYGLSPRVRGNLASLWLVSGKWGSIPACAGEPRSLLMLLKTQTVYPRVCGGTGPLQSPRHSAAGLSPRVRGNRLRRVGWLFVAGSIPACAGEPFCPVHPVFARRVYPRVCGGTVGNRRRRPEDCGLSPRVRGNRPRQFRVHPSIRSIPACAGEPQAFSTPDLLATVYPRVCGGTLHRLYTDARGVGLSPRVRGNRDCSVAMS